MEGEKVLLPMIEKCRRTGGFARRF